MCIRDRLKDENEDVIYLDQESDLAGLPQGVRDGMAQGAEAVSYTHLTLPTIYSV